MNCKTAWLLFALGLSFAEPIAASEMHTWQPPKNGVVRDGKAAITIAHTVWQSMNPGLHISSDEDWQRHMIVSLHDGIWKVAEQPLGKNEIGGGIWFLISQKDGRVVGIHLTQ